MIIDLRVNIYLKIYDTKKIFPCMNPLRINNMLRKYNLNFRIGLLSAL